MRRALLVLAAALGPALPAAAELVGVLEKTWVSNEGEYAKNIKVTGDAVQKGWHTVSWTGYVGWEGEPKRTKGANKFVFQFRGVPDAIKNNGKYLIEYRWKRVSTGALEPGKPYKHESSVGIFNDSACTKSGGGSYNKDLPPGADTFSDKVEVTCWDGRLGSVGSTPQAHIVLGGRPWGGFEIRFRWKTKESADSKK